MLLAWAVISLAIGFGLAWRLREFWFVSGVVVAGWTGFAWVALKRRWVNSLRLLVVAAIPAIFVGWSILARLPQDRHQRELQRIEDWATRSRAFPPPGITREEWRNNLFAIHYSLYGALYRPQAVPTQKLRALADHLDATHGQDFATVAGMLGLIGYLEEICPWARDSGPSQMLREAYPGVVPVHPAIGRK